MSDISNPGFWFANDPQSSSAQAMRQKIALAMMMKKHAAPKNLGEGIFSIGENIGDALAARSAVSDAAAAAAQTDKNIQDMQRGVTPGRISSSAVPGTETDTVVEVTPPGGNAPSWNSFAQEYAPGGLGLSQPQAAGLVGNLQAESTAAIKPSGVVGDEGTAFGAAQWRGPRLEALKQYAASQGVSPWTTEAQQGFMRHEMMGSGGPAKEGEAYAALTKAQTPAAAATAVDDLYERSSGETRGRRIANAENIARTLPNPRDVATAALVAQSQPPVGPAGPQDALLGEVTGMNPRASAVSYAPTANAGRTGDVTSDIPSVTGATPSGLAGQSVIDSVQQRQQGFQQPQATPPAGPQVAQAGPFPAPTLDASGRPAAIIPGGGLPQVMPQQIQAAPQDPRTAIPKAPQYNENDPEPPPPIKPQGIGPQERRLQRQLYGDVDPREKAAAQAIVAREQSDRNAGYENEFRTWEVKKANWLKKQELLLKDTLDQPKTRAEIKKIGAETAGKELENQSMPARLALERKELEAKVGKGEADAQVAQQNAAFQARTGREREPFLKEFATEKEAATKVSGLLRNAKAADEALKTGDVVWGSGADTKLALARIGSAFGNKKAAEVAAASEKYKQASDSTLGYGIMLVNGKDPRVTDADISQAKGLTGTLDMQRASQQRIIDAMREDLHGKVANYEDMREQYLRGDPQHRFFKVDTTPTAPQDQVDVLLKYRDNPQAIATFDRDHGLGAAQLEIKRALRREERAKKVAREDD